MTEDFSNHEWLTPDEVAEHLRVSLHTVWRWCKQGRLPAIQIGRTWRIRRDRLEDMIEELYTGNDSAE